jgi:hypothetical protein
MVLVGADVEKEAVDVWLDELSRVTLDEEGEAITGRR